MVSWATRAAKRPVLFEKGPKRYKGSFQTIGGGGAGKNLSVIRSNGPVEPMWEFRGPAGGQLLRERLGTTWPHITHETAFLLLGLCNPNFSTHP